MSQDLSLSEEIQIKKRIYEIQRMDKLIITLMFVLAVGLGFLIKSYFGWAVTILAVLCLIAGFLFGIWSNKRIVKNLYT